MSDASLIEALAALQQAELRIQTAKRAVNDAIIGQPPDTLTHDFAPAQHAAPFCQMDEPPSRPA